MARATKLCKVHLFSTLIYVSTLPFETRCSKLLHNAEFLSQVNAVTSQLGTK